MERSSASTSAMVRSEPSTPKPFQKFFTAHLNHVPQLSPTVRFCDHPDWAAWPTQAHLSRQRLPDSSGKTSFATALGKLLEAWHHR